MEYKEIIDNYILQKDTYNNIENRLNDKIEYYENKLEKHKKKYLNWIDGIVIPLAKELSKRFNLSYEIYGPFGLCCETSIYLKEDKNKSITEQTTFSITVEPKDLSIGELVYRTGERTNKYPQGSIGELNGFDCITKPMPDTIDEIIKLMHKSERSEDDN